MFRHRAYPCAALALVLSGGAGLAADPPLTGRWLLSGRNTSELARRLLPSDTRALVVSHTVFHEVGGVANPNRPPFVFFFGAGQTVSPGVCRRYRYSPDLTASRPTKAGEDPMAVPITVNSQVYRSDQFAVNADCRAAADESYFSPVSGRNTGALESLTWFVDQLNVAARGAATEVEFSCTAPRSVAVCPKGARATFAALRPDEVRWMALWRASAGSQEWRYAFKMTNSPAAVPGYGLQVSAVRPAQGHPVITLIYAPLRPPPPS